jgi:hypothetical protein
LIVLHEENARRTSTHSPLAPAVLLSALLLTAFVLAGCATSAANLQSSLATAGQTAQAPAPQGLEDVVAPLADYVQESSPLATPTPLPSAEEKQYVTVATQGVRANLRSGPGTNNAIVTKVNSGASLEVLAQSPDKRWYQVVTPGATGDMAKEAWISADIVRVGGSADAVPVVTAGEALLPPDLSAAWSVDWSCNSDRCEVKQCSADVQAVVTRPVSNGYLPVEHTVTWAGECFNTDAWTFEVDQATGEERSGEARDNFLYGYWLGAEPGEPNGVLPLDDDRGVVVFCSEPQKVEIEEGGGWTTVYEGSTCHDVQTGMLVYMNYVKRWLFTGEFEGKTYDRAYFGDSEELEQRLVETNVELDYADKR